MIPSIISAIHKLDKKTFDLLVLICIWLLMIFLVNPIGNFPLLDDWDYGRAVYSLINEGRIQFSSWPQMTLIVHVFWGYLFCLLFGFSFTVLRFSTLFLGLIGVLATYSLIEESRSSRGFAFLGALLVAINPLYFALSNTFMTDIPFFSFAMLSFLFFSRCIRLGKIKYALIGTLFALLVTFIRQIGIVIPLAFTFGYIMKNGVRKTAVLTALLPAAILGGFIIFYQVFQRRIGGPVNFFSPEFKAFLYSTQSDIGLFKYLLVNPIGIFYAIRRVFWYLVITLIHIGLFVFPVLFLELIRQWCNDPH